MGPYFGLEKNGRMRTSHTGAVNFPTTLRYKCDKGYCTDGQVAESKRQFQTQCKANGQLSGSPQRENRAAHKRENRAQNRALDRGTPKSTDLIFLLIFVVKIRWEYLHWTSLGLTKLMEVSIFNIDFTKIQNHKKKNNIFETT